MSRYHIETNAPNGAQISVPIPDEFLDQLFAGRHSQLVRELWELICGGDRSLDPDDVIGTLERNDWPCPDDLKDDE